MKRLMTLFFFFMIQYSFGQLTSLKGKPRAMTRKEAIADSMNKHCIHRNKINAPERLNYYPFNKAKEVRLVSFNKPNELGSILLMKNKIVDTTYLAESQTLDNRKIDSLTDILYNTGYKGKFYSFSEGCYWPRNAILYIDASGKPFAFIELCFQCEGFRLSSKRVNAGQFCVEKYALLKTFFKKNGIKYGTLSVD